jgi:hypothetical protein
VLITAYFFCSLTGVLWNEQYKTASTFIRFNLFEIRSKNKKKPVCWHTSVLKIRTQQACMHAGWLAGYAAAAAAAAVTQIYKQTKDYFVY